MHAGQLKQLIIDTVLLELGAHSPAAVQLLMLTAAQESRLGYYIAQVRGPALGIFQMEPATHADIWDNYLAYRPEMAAKLQRLAGSYPVRPQADVMIYNLKYAAAMARVHYRRVTDPLPVVDDIPAMAAYWKQHYNTPKGRGTVAEAVHNYERYVL
jgi:hypothetical protein